MELIGLLCFCIVSQDSMNFNNNLHPWLFIFKRIKCLNTNRKLTLQEILKIRYFILIILKFIKK